MQTIISQASGSAESSGLLLTLAVLGTYGAFEGFFRLCRYVPSCWRRIKGWWRARVHDEDFYFVKRETGLFIHPDGKHYHYLRSERVRARKRLEQVPVSYRWTGEGTMAERVIPDCNVIEDVPRALGQAGTRRRLKLRPVLEKGHQTSYDFVIDCEATGRPPESFLSSRTSHRVDELLLRVVFPCNHLPRKVFYIERDGDGGETRKEELVSPDLLTGEYRKQVEFAEPHVDHRLEWEFR